MASHRERLQRDRKDRERIDPGEPRRTQGARPAPATWTESILDLQRSAGNSATSSAIQAAAGSISLRTLQRDHTDTGLNKGSSVSSYATKVKERTTGGKNPMGSTKQWNTLSDDGRATKLMKYANAELEKAHAPKVKYTLDATSKPTGGSFDFTTWSLPIGTQGFANMDDAMLAEVADTVYHECRHAEQWFRIARFKAGEKPAPTASELATSLGIPTEIAETALKSPLRAQTKTQKFFHTKEYNERQDKKLSEASSWYEGIYGTGAQNREDVYQDLSNRKSDYLALVEEADAWAVAAKAKAKVSALLDEVRKKESAKSGGG